MSFRLKTILGIALIEGALLLLLVLLGVNFLERSYEQQLDLRANTSVRLFATATKNAIITSDLASLDSLTKEALVNDDVLYARVIDADGNILSESYNAPIANHKFTPDNSINSARSDGIYDTAYEITEGGDSFGRVEIGLDINELSALVDEARTSSGSVAILEMGLVALFSFFLGTYLTRQLKHLETGALKIGKGDLGYQIPVTGSDEIAQTATAFNEMSEKLHMLYNKQNVDKAIFNILHIAQASFISDAQSTTPYKTLLNSLNKLTESDFGLIGEIVLDEKGKPFIKALAIAGDEIEALGEQLLGENIHNKTEFHNFSDLLSRVITSKMPVIDFRSQKPEGVSSSNMHNFIAMPLLKGDKLLGIAMLANSKNTLFQKATENLFVLWGGIANLIHATQKAREYDRTLEKLKVSEERLSLISESSNDGIWDWDMKTGEIYLSPRWELMLGYEPGTLHPHFNSWQNLIHPRDLPMALSTWTECMSGEKDAFSFEYRLKSKSEEYIWVHCKGLVQKDSQTLLQRIIGSHTDITERKQNELAIAKSERYMRAILDNVGEGIITVLEDGSITSANLAIKEILGYEPDEIINKNIRVLLPEAYRTRSDKFIKKLLKVEKGNSGYRELTGHKKDGSAFHMEITISELRDAAHGTSYISLIRDITERKDVEQAMKKANRIAYEAAEAKANFMANMSHEIRTPMHGMLGMLNLLKDTDLSDIQQQYLQTANSSADNLLYLINDVLDYSKIEAGEMHIESINFNLRDCVDDILQLLCTNAYEKNLNIEACVSSEIPLFILSDPVRVRQVITNLVGNAIKFTSSGSVKITANVEVNELGDSFIRVAIKDTGIGISEEHLGSLFEAFKQADDTMSRKYGGTGLGLSICQQLVQLLGGEINVESTLGEGSNFSFSLPMITPTQQPVSYSNEFADKSVVLLCEDEFIQHSISELFKLWNINLLSANHEELSSEQLRAANALLVAGIDNAEYLSALSAKLAQFDKPSLLLARSMLVSAANVTGSYKNILTGPVLSKPLHRAIISLLKGESFATPQESANAEQQLSGSVLVAEDNPVNQDVALVMLSKFGLNVEVAENGRVAVEKLAEHHFDIVFMDCQMPEMNGFEATRAIRQQERRQGDRHQCIIALTANAMEGDAEKCINSGMDDYLPKPFTQEMIFNKLTKHLHSSKIISDTARDTVVVKEPVSEEQAIDTAKLSEMHGMLGDNFVGLIEKYVTNSASLMNAIRETFAAGNTAELRTAAHTLKGGSLTIGAARVGKLAAAIEAQAKENKLAEESEITSLSAALEQFIDYLEQNIFSKNKAAS